MKIEVKFDPNDNVEVGDFLDSIKWLLQLLKDTYDENVIHELHEQSKSILQMLIDAYIEALDKVDPTLKRNNTVDSDKAIPLKARKY